MNTLRLFMILLCGVSCFLFGCYGQADRASSVTWHCNENYNFEFGDTSWLSVDASEIDDVVAVKSGRRLFTLLERTHADLVEATGEHSGYIVAEQQLPANFTASYDGFGARWAARIGQIDENGEITSCAVADVSPLPPCDVHFFDFRSGHESKFHAFDHDDRKSVGLTQLWATGDAREGAAAWIILTVSGGKRWLVWIDNLGRERRRELVDAYELEWPVSVLPLKPQQVGSIVLGGEFIAIADSQQLLRVLEFDKPNCFFSIGSVLALRKSDGAFVVLADVFHREPAIPIISGLLGLGYTELRCRVRVDSNGLTRVGPFEDAASSTENQIDRRSVPIPVDEWVEGEPARVGIALVRGERDSVLLRCVASDINSNIVATTSQVLPGFAWSRNSSYSRRILAVCVRDATVHVLFETGHRVGVLRLTKRAG